MYYLLPEGKSLINKIKFRLNNFRLSSNTSLTKEENFEDLSIDTKKVFALKATYKIKNGIIIHSEPKKWVSDKIKVITIDNLGNEIFFDNILECSLSLKISKDIVKDCIVKGKSYKNFTFKLNVKIM